MARALIPNSTQIPDLILDHWMAELSGAEFKVLLYVARRTYGFGKESDNISLNQMAAGIRRRDGSCLDRGTGLSRSGVKAACSSLIQRGILVRVHNRNEERRECEESTYRLNLFAAPGRVGQKKAQVGRKCARGGPAPDREVGQELTPQDTEQETEQETAAGRPRCEKAQGAAADSLLEGLVSHGVGRAVAERLVREKPEACRRQLAYLPFARFRTTKGAWLANAIRDDYGPPPGYEAERAKGERERQAEATRLSKESLQLRAAAIKAARRARVGDAYRELEEAKGEAFSAFCEHVESERARTVRIARHLSPERQDELLSAFDKPERRLELFEAWMNSRQDFSPKEPGSPRGSHLSPASDAQRSESKGGLFVAQAS